MTASDKIPPAKRSIRSMPLELWPEADFSAWNAACQPAARLKRGGAAGHIKPVTRDDHARHYGNFLGFLNRRGLLRRDGPAAANVTPENIDAYLAELKQRVSSVTVHGSICKLRRAARYIDPRQELAWLLEIAKDLALVAQPRSKFDRLVLTEVLVEAGLTLIREAEHSQKMTKLARAFQVRNALMVSLLALCPIRRRNFTALEIGRSFVKIQDRWWIVLSAAETKEKRADERPVDELLTAVIDRYLGEHRPVLARSGNTASALWLSANNGAPITDKEVARVIGSTTLATVGVRVSPHLFRTSAASTAAAHLGETPSRQCASAPHRSTRHECEL